MNHFSTRSRLTLFLWLFFFGIYTECILVEYMHLCLRHFYSTKSSHHSQSSGCIATQAVKVTVIYSHPFRHFNIYKFITVQTSWKKQLSHLKGVWRYRYTCWIHEFQQMAFDTVFLLTDIYIPIYDRNNIHTVDLYHQGKGFQVYMICELQNRGPM